MLCSVSFAGIPFQFSTAAEFSFFSTWQWRLDPYLTAAEEKPDCLVQSDTVRKSDSPLEELFQDEPSGFFQRQVLPAADGGTFWQFLRRLTKEIYIRYCVSPDWSHITLLEDHTDTAGQLAFEYLGQIMPSVLLNHSILTFHGVLMEHNGRGIIISAESGTGKTTHARLWRDHKRALIINGDRATCRKVDGVWTGFGLPWSGTSGEQINRSVPLTALVILERGAENEAHRISGLEAFGAMWPHVQYPQWDEALTGTALELADDFLNEVPVIHLHCRPDADSVEVLNKALEEL